MADRGRLSKPLTLKSEQIGAIPVLAGVDVPLAPKDVRRALEFLAQAKLVSFKRRSGAFEVELKEDRYIRVPRDGPVSRSASPVDISTKILARWATHRVKSPVSFARVKTGKAGGRRIADPRQARLF